MSNNEGKSQKEEKIKNKKQGNKNFKKDEMMKNKEKRCK